MFDCKCASFAYSFVLQALPRYFFPSYQKNSVIAKADNRTIEGVW